MIRDSRLFTFRSLKMARTEIGSVAEMMEPNSSATSTGGQQQQGYGISKQLSQVEFHAAFKNKRRKKQDQDDVGRQPIGPVAGLERRQKRDPDRSKQEAAENKGHRVRNPQAFRQHRDDRGGDKQPNQEFNA